MLPDKPQIALPAPKPFIPKPLPKHVKNNYKELADLINLQIKLAKLRKAQNEAKQS